MPGGAFVTSGASSTNIRMIDSGSVRIIQITQDSAGVPVTRVFRDSVGAGASSLGSPFGVPTALTSMATRGLLRSGLVSIRETLDAFMSGRLTTYGSAVAMTKTEGWP